MNESKAPFGMKRFWLVNVLPEFRGIDEDTGEELFFKNWRVNVVDVFAANVDHAKEVAGLTGFQDGIHYNDIVEVKG